MNIIERIQRTLDVLGFPVANREPRHGIEQTNPPKLFDQLLFRQKRAQGRGGDLPPIPSNARDLGEDRHPVPGGNHWLH